MFCMILRERSIATATTTIKGKQRLQVKGTHTELLRPLKMIKNKWGVRGKKKKEVRKFILRSVLEDRLWPGWCPVMTRSKAEQ